MCNFSSIADFPEMYRHCKETEDPNLSAIDFLTEHLVDFDSFFEEEKENNNEKPHKQTYQHCQPVNCIVTATVITIQQPKQFTIKLKHSCKNDNNLYPSFHNNILRPPIV